MSQSNYSPNDFHSSKTLRIAALGSSYASGPGIRPMKNVMAMRSRNNYATIVARRLNADLTDLTVSGATLGNVMNEPQKAYLFKKFPPQLEGLPRDVDVVTITGGGNDLNYDNAIFRDVLRSKFFGRLIYKLIPVPGDADKMDTDDIVQRFLALIDRIREINPNCKILLVEYFTILGPDCIPGKDIGLTEKQMEYHGNVGKKLQQAYEDAARQRPGVESVPVREQSRLHGLGSKEPWLQNFSWSLMFKGKAPFHPKIVGMERVADMVYDVLKGGPQSGGKVVEEKVGLAGEQGRSDEVNTAMHEDRKLVI